MGEYTTFVVLWVSTTVVPYGWVHPLWVRTYGWKHHLWRSMGENITCGGLWVKAPPVGTYGWIHLPELLGKYSLMRMWVKTTCGNLCVNIRLVLHLWRATQMHTLPERTWDKLQLREPILPPEVPQDNHASPVETSHQVSLRASKCEHFPCGDLRVSTLPCGSLKLSPDGDKRWVHFPEGV